MEIWQFSLFLAAVAIGFVVVWLRSVRTDPYLHELARLRGIEDRLRAIEERMRETVVPAPVPDDSALVGVDVYFQGYVVDPGPSPLPGAMTRRLRLRITP